MPEEPSKSAQSRADQALDPEQAPPDAICVVGIGASAGGLEPLRRLLAYVPSGTGMAFVLIRHLDPNYINGMSQILGRATSMPVLDAIEGTQVEPDRVYVTPPNTVLTIENQVLRVGPRTRGGPHLPIDNFLRSLALDGGATAIGVILSGVGSDGLLGLQAIKDAGGITFVQGPETAEFPGMPGPADAAASADFVLPPERIGEELGRIASAPWFAAAEPPLRVEPAEKTDHVSNILSIMHEATGIDFSLYKERTVERRLLRRVALRNIASLEEYGHRLRTDQSEIRELQRDLLIGVTSFFREPRAFEALKKVVFPAIVKDRPDGLPIRIWVPGCATGEEVYSIAISLQEFLIESGQAFHVQIFATDINETAVELARTGNYRNNIEADVSPERLRRFFTKAGGGYQISRTLREMCIFSTHNLVDDPPFSRLDLISCRNLLTYLAVQKDIIPMFHYALREPGFLLLGRCETAHFDDLFSLIDRELSIYAKKRTGHRLYGFNSRSGKSRRDLDGNRGPAPMPVVQLRDSTEMGRAVDHILLTKYCPAAVLVDEALSVLEIRGQVAPFLTLPAGRMSSHLMKLIPDTSLLLAVEKLVHEVASSGKPARREGVPYECDGRLNKVNVEVTPVRGKQRSAQLILFDPVQTVSRGEREAATDDPVGLIGTLNQALEEARQRLVSIVEEQEISLAESQSTIEEALSANEEVQSLNEEMETAKKQLQSANEELITTNRELEARNFALAQAEQALRSSENQKMQVVGKLAGGIAHDFGNLLSAINAYCALIANSLTARHEALEYVAAIEESLRKAATLADQLLAVGLKKAVEPKVLDLNIVIGDVARILRHLLDDRIRIETHLAAGLCRVFADQNEIEHAVTNICLNARDAMPSGGTLTISTAKVILDEAEARKRKLRPQEYARLDIRDTGAGMSPETRARIFEPFFTTKEAGKAKGLGLAMVLGIVEQNKGAVWFDSVLGRGTTFTILVPAMGQAPDDLKRPSGVLAEASRGRTEVILLVEDEDLVRMPTRKILESRGYTVLEARDGYEGLSVCENHKGDIDLLVCDVIVPGLGGRQLAERAVMIRPDLKVLFMSAYTEDVILTAGVIKGTPFLKKPYSGTDLANSVREALDARLDSALPWRR